MTTHEKVFINYLSAISSDKESNLFPLPWNQAFVMRNYVKDTGVLIDLSQSSLSTKPWVLLYAKQFYDGNSSFIKFICNECCKTLLSLKSQQNEEIMNRQMCLHSKVCEALLNPETLDFYNQDNSNKVKILLSKSNKGKNSQSLSAVYVDEKISLLFTCGRQTRPRCSECSSIGCKCFQIYSSFLKNSSIASSTSSTDTGQDESYEDIDEPHYEDHEKPYGYNRKDILYPLYRDPEQLKMIKERKQSSFTFPNELFLPFDENVKC